MSFSLRNHPFAVRAHFERSIVLTFAVEVSELRSLVPSRLELDTFADSWGFVAVAIVQTRSLRPHFVPMFAGSDFILIGYRAFVRYTGLDGKRIRGLYILRSETNSRKMEVLGNIFTHYNYSTIDVTMTSDAALTTVTSQLAEVEIDVDLTKDEPSLPSDSPFRSWKEARRFAGPLPFTFTVDEVNNEVLIIEGVREQWSPRPVEVIRRKVGFLESLNLQSLVLANAFVVEDIPYSWKKGRRERWSGRDFRAS